MTRANSLEALEDALEVLDGLVESMHNAALREAEERSGDAAAAS
jgi:hypothetical protein